MAASFISRIELARGRRALRGSVALGVRIRLWRRRLISFGLVGCTFVRAFDKFPLKSQGRIHLDPLRQKIRAFGTFPLMSQWRIHQDQHLDLLRQNYLVFFVVRSSVPLARRGGLCRSAVPATCNRNRD